MQEILNSDQRLVILRSLVECGDSANESILQTCLQTYGHRVSRDTVRTLLAWLREQGLVTLSDVSGCYVAGITGRGEDVAFGLATVPGVKNHVRGSDDGTGQNTSNVNDLPPAGGTVAPPVRSGGASGVR